MGEIKRVARKYPWDMDVSIFICVFICLFVFWSGTDTLIVCLAAIGCVEGLLDYDRIRSDMSRYAAFRCYIA